MYYRNFCSLPSPSHHRIVAQHRVVDYSVKETELQHGTERMLLVLSANGAEIMYTRDEECTHGTPISIALFPAITHPLFGRLMQIRFPSYHEQLIFAQHLHGSKLSSSVAVRTKSSLGQLSGRVRAVYLGMDCKTLLSYADV
jgi:hypothetical protein